MKRIIAISILVLAIVSIPALKSYADTIPVVKEVLQKIVYKTNNATEVTLVWGINEWQVPPDSLRPPNSYLKNNVLYTTMQGNRDSFEITIKVPAGTYINYIFWLSKDLKGEEYDFWDNFYGHNYSVFVRDENIPKVHVDTYSEISDEAFYLLPKGPMLFFISLLILFSLGYIYRKKKFLFHSINQPALLIGTGFSIFFIMLLARLQMNEKIQHSKELLPGAVFYDLLFLFVILLISIFLLILIRNRLSKNIIFGIAYTLLLITGFMAILNTEIVKFLGTPLNFQWLYYSGFLKSADAKVAMSSNLSNSLIWNISFLTLSFILAGFAFSGFLVFNKRNKVFVWSSLVIFIACLIIGKIQINQEFYVHTKIDNPIVTFFNSWIKAGKRDPLFTIKVDDKILKEVTAIHTPGNDSIYNSNVSINKIIIFVMESVPAEYLDVYDSTYGATPNIQKWKSKSRIFNNIYAHVPATYNSLFSLVTGNYPNISFRSGANDNKKLPITSLSSLLKKNN